MSANVVDEPPFIVMPYMRHGNAKDYILDHPEFNRPQMLLHVARGLAYLHRESVIHGDIKAPISFSLWTNILIDNGFNAVLADFGLSQLKTDVSTRVRSKLTVDGSTANFGSYYWMAPERLTGGQMLFASDLYSFGMTMYEIFTCEIPLGNYPLIDYVDAVVKQNLRPRRPVSQGRVAIEMSDELWSICTQCWCPEPSHRPNAASV
ncbi:kinase-like protein, partial [Flagelloscypha sp. PMI_526]